MHYGGCKVVRCLSRKDVPVQQQQQQEDEDASLLRRDNDAAVSVPMESNPRREQAFKRPRSWLVYFLCGHFRRSQRAPAASSVVKKPAVNLRYQRQVKIEPKTYFANERTLLQWLNMVVFLALLAVSMLTQVNINKKFESWILKLCSKTKFDGYCLGFFTLKQLIYAC